MALRVFPVSFFFALMLKRHGFTTPLIYSPHAEANDFYRNQDLPCL